jgi:hypothetical protein
MKILDHIIINKVRNVDRLVNIIRYDGKSRFTKNIYRYVIFVGSFSFGEQVPEDRTSVTL